MKSREEKRNDKDQRSPLERAVPFNNGKEIGVEAYMENCRGAEQKPCTGAKFMKEAQNEQGGSSDKNPR